MARYSLVALNRDAPYGSEHFVVTFNKKGENIAKVNLEDIDAFTTAFSSLAQLEDYIKEKCSVSFPLCQFEIQYMYDGEIRKLTTLVNQPFLNRCAKYSIERRKQTGKNVLTNEIPEFENFKKRILYYMKSEESVHYLLDDSAYIVSYGIKKETKQFYQLSNLTYQSPYQRTEIKDIEENIDHILSNYRNTRAMVEWEQLYLKGELRLRKKASFIKASTQTNFTPPTRKDERMVEGELDPDEFAFLSEEEKRMMAGGDEGSVYWKLR